MASTTYATAIQFTPDVPNTLQTGGTASGTLLYYDGTDPFSRYLTLAQVQAELGRIAADENAAAWAQSLDSPVPAHPAPDLRDVARKVAWDCWVSRLPAHTPPPAPPTPPPPPTPIVAPDVSGP
jgi:hypothetical protein